MTGLQLSELFEEFDKLQLIHGASNLKAIYGCGKIKNPKICLVFMNPTAKNISSLTSWEGIRAPWLGTKNVWKLLIKLGLLENNLFIEQLLALRPQQWTNDHAVTLYKILSDNSIYITNIAKCTQEDARHLPDSVFKEYRQLMLKELELVNPDVIITMGNQVSSVLLQKQILVSKYTDIEYENLTLPNGKIMKVYPTYYPVGQGMRNMPKTINRIRKIV